MRSADLSRHPEREPALTGQTSMADLAEPDGTFPSLLTKENPLLEQLAEGFACLSPSRQVSRETPAAAQSAAGAPPD